MIPTWVNQMPYRGIIPLTPGQAATKAALKAHFTTHAAANNNPRLKANSAVPVTLTVVPFATGSGSYTSSHRWSNSDVNLRSQGGKKLITAANVGVFPAAHQAATGGNDSFNTGGNISTWRSYIGAPASATTVYHRMLSSATVVCRVLIRDPVLGWQYVNQVGIICHPDASSQVYLKMDFTDGLAHDICIEMCYGTGPDGYFGLVTDVYTPPSAAVAPFDNAFNVIFAGESIFYGAGDGGNLGPTVAADNPATYAADSMAFREAYDSAVSGTGWVYQGAGPFFNLQQRRTDITASLAWDLIIPAMGTNDWINNIPRATIAAAVAPELAAYRVSNPNALILPVLTWDTGAPGSPKSAAQVAVDNGILDGIRNAGIGGCFPMDPTGVAYAKAGSDLIHPSTAGAATLGAWLDNSIRAIVNA